MSGQYAPLLSRVEGVRGEGWFFCLDCHENQGSTSGQWRAPGGPRGTTSAHQAWSWDPCGGHGPGPASLRPFLRSASPGGGGVGGGGSAVGPCRVLGCAPLGGFGSGFPTSLWGVEHTRLCQGPETPGSDAVHPAPQSIRAWSCAASRPAERSPRLRLVPAPSRVRTATLCGSSLAAGAGAAGEPSVPWFCGSVVRSALRRRTRSRWAFSPLNPALCLRPGRPRPPQPGAQEPARQPRSALPGSAGAARALRALQHFGQRTG